MHGNSGYGAEALPLARRFADVFAGFDAVVSPSGSCVAMVREQYAALAREAGDAELLERVEALAPRVFELTQFLVDELGVEDVGAVFPHRVTYHPACHALRALRIGDAPLRLLRNVAGIELVELPQASDLLRLRRHLRGQERRHVGGDADRQAPRGPRHRRRGRLLGRQLVPAAHRRRAVAAAQRGARDARRRDPGARDDARARRAFPDGRARGARATRSCAATCARPRTTIRDKRAAVVAELRRLGGAARGGAPRSRRTPSATSTATSTTSSASVTARGGVVHWARDAAEANAIVARLTSAAGAREVIKVKSLATDEIGLNEALAREGIAAIGDRPRRADRPARRGPPVAHPRPRDPPQPRGDRGAVPRAPARRAGRLLRPAPRSPRPPGAHLREKFLSVRVGVSGANFAVAETGTVCVVESEGNGRMCTTLPEVLITVMGIEKVLPRFADLEVMLQLLPRSSTGERMNPYTSLWTGVRRGDGPQAFHLVLLDNGRTTRPGRRGRPRRAALHPLQRLPERLPGLRAHGRARLRRDLPRADRRDPRPAARRAAGPRRPPVGQLAVRRLLRGLPGQDRHPARSSCTCAGASSRRAAPGHGRLDPERSAMAALGRVFRTGALRGRAEGRAARRAGRCRATGASSAGCPAR